MDPTNLLGLLGAQTAGLAGMPQVPDVASQLPSFAPIQAALANNALKPNPQAQPQPQQGRGLFHQGGTISNILGALGDAFLVQSGHEPIYSKMREQQKLGTALANYLGGVEPGMQAIFNEDPGTGLELYKIKHPASETPAGLKEFEYYKGLQGPDRAAYEQFLKLTHPGMLSPITLGPNDTYDPGSGGGTATGGSLPHVTDEQSYNAVPNGAQYTAPDGTVRTKGGATASTPSATFPAR